MGNKYVLLFGGGKDSTALLIYLLKNKYPLDEIIFCSFGKYAWNELKDHIKKVEIIGGLI